MSGTRTTWFGSSLPATLATLGGMADGLVTLVARFGEIERNSGLWAYWKDFMSVGPIV